MNLFRSYRQSYQARDQCKNPLRPLAYGLSRYGPRRCHYLLGSV